MFERFTNTARQCVALAQEEVRELGSDHIGTEHLLIGVVREPNGLGGHILRHAGVTVEGLRADARRIGGPGPLDRDALATLGIDIDEVRRRVEESFGPNALEGCADRPGEPRRIRCSPSSKKAIQLALRFAMHMGDDFIGSEHVLWGIARVEDGVGARVLAERGLTREQIEGAIRRARQAA